MINYQADIPGPVLQALQNASYKTGVPLSILAAIAGTETYFGKGKVSFTQVKGMMQITEQTWRHIVKTHNLKDEHGATLGYSEDINQQAYVAALKIKEAMDKYGDDVRLIAIEYNVPAVAAAVKRYGSPATMDQDFLRSIITDEVTKIYNKIPGDQTLQKKGFEPSYKIKEIFDHSLKVARYREELLGLETSMLFFNNKDKHSSFSFTSNIQPQPTSQLNFGPGFKISSDKTTLNDKIRNFLKPEDSSLDFLGNNQFGENHYQFDENKSFVANITSANYNQIKAMQLIDESHMKESKLVARIKIGLAALKVTG